MHLKEMALCLGLVYINLARERFELLSFIELRDGMDIKLYLDSYRFQLFAFC